MLRHGAKMRGHVQRHTGGHDDFEHQIADHGRADHHVEVAVKDELPRGNERVVEPTDLVVPDMRAGTERVLHTPICGEQTDPSWAVVHGGRLR